MTIKARNFHPAAIFHAPVVCAFWILLICILFHPRGFVQPNISTLHHDAIKQGQPAGFVDLAILAFQCALCATITLFSRVRINQALGLPGILIIGAFLSYIFIGFTVSAIIDEYGFRVDIGEFFRNHAFFLPALLGIAFGGRQILARMEIDTFLKHVLRLLIAGCVCIIISSAWPLSEFTLGDVGKRFRGFHFNPGNAGMIGCATFALALSFLSKPGERLFGYLGLIIGLLTVIGSLSKTGIAALIAIFFFVLVFSGKKRRFPVIIFIGFLAILFAVAVDIVEQISELERLRQVTLLFGEGTGNVITTGRMDLWSLGLRRALESPIYGHGLGTLWKMDVGAFAKSYGGDTRMGVHNSYIMVFGEAGFLPLLLYLMHAFSLVRLWWTVPNSVARCMVIGWTITFFSFAFTSNYVFDSWILGFICGLVCAISAAASETRGRAAPGQAPA